MMYERVEFVHYVLEHLDMGLQEYLIADCDNQLLLAKTRHRVVNENHSLVKQHIDSAPDPNTNALSLARQKLRCKRYTTDLNSDADPVHLHDVDADIPDPASRVLSEVTRRRHLIQHMLGHSNDPASLEKLLPYIRT